MKEVVPYEHYVKKIKEFTLQTKEQILLLYDIFLKQEDKWIRKLIAARLLECNFIEEIQIDINQLKESTKCQIKL